MDKKKFLTKVTEVMKGMISHKDMMASIQRSCMRGEAENLDLMSAEEEKVDRFINGITQVATLDAEETITDVLVLRFLKNTQFLANIKEDDIDVSGLGENDLAFWKKTMLFRAP